MELKQVELVS